MSKIDADEIFLPSTIHSTSKRKLKTKNQMPKNKYQILTSKTIISFFFFFSFGKNDPIQLTSPLPMGEKGIKGGDDALTREAMLKIKSQRSDIIQ